MKVEKIFPWAILFVAVFVYAPTFFPPVAGKFLVLYSAGLLSLIYLLLPPFSLPKISNREAIGSAILAALSLGALFCTRPADYFFPLLDRLSFFSLALGAWRAFRSGRLSWADFYWPTAASIISVSGYGLFQIAELGFPEVTPFDRIGSFFGYANNAAQFVGLCLVLLWALPKSRATFLVSVVALIYLALARNRSAYFSLAFAGLLWIYVAGLARQLPWKKIGAGAALVALLFAGFQLAKGRSLASVLSLEIVRTKGPLADSRIDIWKSTLGMIQDHPWLGVGADGFGFPFTQYMKGGADTGDAALTIAPHNEYLRYPAEDGIPLALLYLAAWIYFLRRWWKHASQEERGIGAATLGFFAAEAFVQFPFQNPAPLLVLALLTGGFAARAWPEASRRMGPRYGLALAAAGVAILVARAWITRTYEKSSDINEATVACEVVAGNWRACLNFARVAERQGRDAEARSVVQQLLHYEPYNFSALGHMAYLSERKGDPIELCYHLWRYDDFFHGHSSLHDRFEKVCAPKLKEYLKRKRPLHFYGKQAPDIKSGF
jgi:O-antigen ligase